MCSNRVSRLRRPVVHKRKNSLEWKHEGLKMFPSSAELWFQNATAFENGRKWKEKQSRIHVTNCDKCTGEKKKRILTYSNT